MLADLILYIDSEALIVDKPGGLPVDPPRDGGISVANHLSSLMLGHKSWPQPVHRLDRDTSGCLMLGRSAKAVKRLSAAFEAGLVTKRYLAVLDGVPDAARGVVELALGKRSTARDGWRMVPDVKGKAATTAWEVLAVVNGRALVALRPTTGRTHQLRVHAATAAAQGGIGHAIVGDPVYGIGDMRGMMLHASDLSVARPGKRAITAHAPSPARFAALGFADPDADPYRSEGRAAEQADAA
jgi:tRNA pseudouridine32 synthase / 23S rRNA pseudouridine746 synthase